MSNQKQKYRHEDTGKVQEMTPAMAALFPRFQAVRLEAELDSAPASVEASPTPSAKPTLLTEPAVIPALESDTAKAPKVARRGRTTER